MKKNNVTYSIFSFIVLFFYLLSLTCIFYYVFSILGLREEEDFLVGFVYPFICLIIIFWLTNSISIIFHEIGHLIFGLHAKLRFIAFSFFGFKIIKIKGKLKLRNNSMVPGTLGYCSFEFNENKSYDKNKIKLYFLGGIIFNIILAIIFSLLLLIAEELVFVSICLFFITINIYLALNNSIPRILKSGQYSDMMHLQRYMHDPEYTKIFGRISKIQSKIKSGYKLEELDEELFYMPKDFKYNSSIDVAQIYIDYLIAKKDYKRALKNIRVVREKAKSLLEKSQIHILELQEIECIFYTESDLKQIEKIWNEDLERYINIISKTTHEFLVFKYMYYRLIKQDINKSNEIKYYLKHKRISNEIKRFIKEIDERVK